jgi:putative NADH-flavin reductase
VRIFVLGGTGRTGGRLIAQGLDRGHEMTAVVRTGSTLAPRQSLAIANADVRSPAELAAALRGHDIAISLLGHVGRNHTILAESATALLEAMTMAAVARCLFVSQGLLFPSSNPVVALLRLLLAPIVADSRMMEDAIRSSSHRWTIVRPPRLTNKGHARGYRVTNGRRPAGGWAMDRVDLAEFLLDETETAKYPNTIVGIGPSS